MKFYLIVISVLLFNYTNAQQKSATLVQSEALLIDARYEEVIRAVDNSNAQNDELILLYNMKAEALISIGKQDEAMSILLQNQEQIKKRSQPEPLNSITESIFGFLYLNKGRTDLAFESLLHATTVLQQNKNTQLEAAKALSYLGNLYRSTGKYTQAEEQLQMALSIRQKELPENHELIAASYNDLGLVYSQLDVDKAFEFYETALGIYSKVHGSDHPKIAIANTNLGVLYRSEKLYGDAVNYFESALEIWSKIYPQAHPNKALVLMNLGQTYSSMGDQKVALEFYNKALAMYEAAQGKKHPDVAYVYNLLGNEKAAQQKFDEALLNYQKALIANIPEFASENIVTNPSTKSYYNGNQLLYSLMYKAQALELKYLGKTLKDSDLILSTKTLQVADTLIDRLRQQASNESDKITLGAIASEIYADGVRIAHMLSEAAIKNRKEYRELSFYFAEKSKSAVLQEAISDTNAKSFANIPDELLEEEKNLKATIALISQKLAQKPEEETERKLRETLFTTNRSYEEFIKRLESKYPEYFNLKFNSAAPGIEQIQKILPEKTALISYFIDEKNSRLYTYIISAKKFKTAARSLPKEYDRYLTGLRNSLYFQDIHSFKLASRNLYKILFSEKIPTGVTDLVIVPTGRMSIIPFETLLTTEAKSIDYRELPYLVKTYSVRYEFSAGLVLQKKQQRTSTADLSVMLCAPVTFPEKDNLDDLPGSETEVKAIAQLFTNKNIGSQLLLQSQATETEIKSGALKDYSLLHFATHGIVDENSPELSRIFLQNSSDTEDGNLFAGEIYNLKLNADLVALSACQTGLGKISKGEGVIGLSRALVYAGAKNIIVSFWSVADESTSELMTDFYRQFLENKQAGYSEDLRNAKLNLLKGQYSAPYYWAPFILIGF